MEFKPHKYQKYCIDYIVEHGESAIFLDMGLGKTVITLSALNRMLYDTFEIKKVLVIAPLNVAKNTWPAELEKWDHLKNLKMSVVTGTERQRMNALCEKADIYVINRECIQWLVEKSGYYFDFDCIVIDELSSFKNHQAKRFKSLLKVRPRAKKVIGLTGTPSANSLMDLFAEFLILDLGKRLGRYISRYRASYFEPDKRNAYTIFTYKPLPGAEERIYEKISDMTISMKSVDYLDMPEKVVNEYPVYMSAQERKNYEDLKRELVLTLPEGEEVTASNAASLSMKLNQMANGCIYDDEHNIIRIHERKLDALDDIIEAANGKPILVAYWFKHDLESIKARLDKNKVYYSVISSDESIRKWNKGEYQVGLIQPASSGLGLNLQDGGSTIVWYSLTWSLQDYLQCCSRLYRQGQKDKTVVIQHLVCKDTIDENILAALNKKNVTQSALIDAVKAQIGGKR